MKKILLFASALAGLFLAGCQRENLEPEQAGQQVTFTIEAPAAMQTKAIADGQNVDELVYEVWITPTLGNLTTGAQKLYQATAPMVSDGTTNKAELTLDLVNDQKFTVLFWAQVAGTYDTDELTAVGYKDITALKANDESLAAFYGVAYVKDGSHVKKDESSASAQVILKRPFAQLNLCTINTSTAYTVVMEKSEVIVKDVRTVFNVNNSVASSPVPVTFDMAAVPSDPATITVNNKEYQYAGMNYMFAGDNIHLEYNIQTKLNGQSEAIVNNEISSVPLKENYRTNIVGNLLTSKTDFVIIVDADFNIPDELVGEGTVLAKTSDDLVKALKRNEEHLVIDLVGTQTKAMTPVEFQVPVGAWTEKYYFGGDKTRTITINANGNKINFVHEDTDWNYIRMVNENAKWIINDATLTNSGANNGPWNRHDIRFYNAVELNNVTSDKAIALLNDGELNDVQISDVHPTNSEAYGLWITATGQTVSLNGVTITPAEGKTTDRAIKIGDQYVDSPAKVTLSVSNSKFVAQKKAAILVTSPAGAVINWGAGNDIKGIAADPINAVWVDEKYAQYDSEVKVEGASKVVEGAVGNVAASTQETLNQALEDATTAETTTVVVNLAEGTYTFPGSALSAKVVLNCAEGTVFQGNSKANIKGATVIGATFSNPTGTAVDQTINGTFKDCVFEGSNALRWCYAGETVVFENCVFSGSVYGVHFDGGANDVLFKNCTFSGFNAFGGAITMATFDGCTFVANGKSGYNGANLWGNTTMINTEFTFDGTASTEWVDLCGADDGSYTFNGCTVCGKPMPIETIGVYTENPNDVDITFNGVKYENYKTSTFISTSEELAIFATQVNEGENFKGKKVYLLSDIDLAGNEWTPIGNSTNQFQGTFDGNNKTISNLVITGNNSNVGLFGMTTNGEIKNLTVNNAKVSGYLNVAVVAGTPYTSKYTNINVTGHVEVNGFAYVGAVGGKNAYANWTDVTVDVDETSYVNANSVENGTAYRTYVGGVCGFNGEGGHSFTNISSNIDVTGSTIDVGGLFGIAHYGNNFVNCSCSGDVEITAAAEAADAEEIGGIAGVWNNGGADVTFDGCSFTGTLKTNITEGVDLSDNTIVGKAYSASGTGKLIIK